MKSSMPMDEAADKRPIVPGTSIPFLRLDGNGDMLSGKGKYLAGNEELPTVVDAGIAPRTVAIDVIAGEYDRTRTSWDVRLFEQCERPSSFLHRNADSGPAETVTARVLGRQRPMLV